MPATVAWAGYGVVDTADTAGNWTAVKITSGGQAPTAVAADAAYEGSNNVTCRSDNKRVYMYADIGAGNELDFTGGGAQEGQMFYIWVNFLPSPLLNTQAGGGLGVFMESRTPSATVYSLWYFHGRDTYTGGWIRLVCDPTSTPSATAGAGAFDPAAVRYFGAFADNNQGTAKYDNFVVDQCAVGTGLIVTGTSTTDALIADLIADENTNRRGIITPLNDSETAVELNGSLTLGDTTAATNSTLSDINAKIFLAEPRYYETTLKGAVPTDYFNINVVGGTGTNSIIIGEPVGADSGRSGWSIVGNDTYNLNIDFDDGNVNTSEWYGCSFEDVTGTITFGTNTAHKIFNSTFSGCNQFDPVGGVQIRNCNFVSLYDDGTADASKNSTVLWNGSIDIRDCNFLANTHSSSDIAHGIEHPAAGSFDYYDLVFSGNEIDVHFSAGTGNLTINKNGTANPSTSTNDSTGTVTITGSVTVEVEVVNGAGTPIEDASVYLKTSGGTVVLNGLSNASGIVSGSYSGATPAALDTTVSEVRSGSQSIPYQPFVLGGSITASGYSQTAILQED